MSKLLVRTYNAALGVLNRAQQCVHCDGDDFKVTVAPYSQPVEVIRVCMCCGDKIVMNGVKV